MFIDEQILLKHGAIVKKYDRNEIVFHEGEFAKYFYQIKVGRLKMFNMNSENKELIQGVFTDGESFGEPPLFVDEQYPASAMALTNCSILKIAKENLIQLLLANPKIQLLFINLFAHRVLYKSKTLRNIVYNTPSDKIICFLRTYKDKNSSEDEQVKIPFTRQEIANFTGLRVETVIRTLKKMEEKNMVSIVNRNLFY